MTSGGVIIPKLSKFLVTSARIASILNWKSRRDPSASVMSLYIKQNHIGIAIGLHPKHGSDECRKVREDQDSYAEFETICSMSLRTNDDKKMNCDHKNTKYFYEHLSITNDNTKDELLSFVKQHNVCAYIVNWPLIPLYHRMGDACGKVLHTLDKLHITSSKLNGKMRSDEQLFSDNRPFALVQYDPSMTLGVHDSPQYEEDAWGRIPMGFVPDNYVPGVWYSSKTGTLHRPYSNSRATSRLENIENLVKNNNEDDGENISNEAFKMMKHFMMENWSDENPSITKQQNCIDGKEKSNVGNDFDSVAEERIYITPSLL